MAHVNVHQLSNGELHQLRMARWKARTDLTYLAREILGYKDVTGPARFPFMNHLQKFPCPSAEVMEKCDRLDRGNWFYTPPRPMLSLEGPRNVLIIDPRGFLKTTINAQSHSIQWILNYPDIAMMLIQSNTEKAQIILSEIKHPFQANPRFRGLFPDYCPTRRINDWGTKSDFTTDARSKTEPRKEPTMMVGSIDKGSAGIHVDVMKFSDIVEPNNVRTPDQINDVIRSFNMMKNLLVSPEYWRDVEGTTYDFSDLYSEIIKRHKKALKENPDKEPEWSIHIRGCYKKDTSSLAGAEEKFTPQEMDTLPYLYAPNGEKISNWPERWTFPKLEAIRAADEYAFATQQLNNPQEAGGETLPFPVNNEFPKWITQENFKKNVRLVHYTTTVDTAETQTARADYTTITTVGWDQAGRPYVVEIRHGKWLPDEIINNMVAAQLKWNPVYMAIEETAYVRGFKDGLNRFLQINNLFINLNFIKRESTVSKKERILNTLQPWYKHGELRFLRGLGHGENTPEGNRITEELTEELRKFPRYIHDDILDSLSDHFQGREWLGRLAPRNTDPWNSMHSEAQQKELYAKQFEKLLGIDSLPFERLNGGSYAPVPQDTFYDRTGGM